MDKDKFPMNSGKKCLFCGEDVIYLYKRDIGRGKRFCSVECWNKSHQKYIKVISERTCPTCGKKFLHYKKTFCCKTCSNRWKVHTAPKKELRTCQYCGIKYKSKSPTKYCSPKCSSEVRNRKYKLDKTYFLNMDSNKFVTLGKLWYSSIIVFSDFRLYGEKEELEKILEELKSDYKIRKVTPEIERKHNFFRLPYVLKISDPDFIDQLILNFGFTPNIIYRQWPDIPDKYNIYFLRGLMTQTQRMEITSGEIFRIPSKNIAYRIRDEFNIKIFYFGGYWIGWWSDILSFLKLDI